MPSCTPPAAGCTDPRLLAAYTQRGEREYLHEAPGGWEANNRIRECKLDMQGENKGHIRPS